MSLVTISEVVPTQRHILRYFQSFCGRSWCGLWFGDWSDSRHVQISMHQLAATALVPEGFLGIGSCWDGNCLPQIHPLKHWSCGCLENQTGWETPRNTTKHHKDCFEPRCLANLRKLEAGTFLPNKHYQWNSSDTLFVSFTTYISARVQFQYPVYSILVKLMTSLDFRFGFPICKSLHGIGISAQAWQPHRAFLKTPRKASGEVTSFIASW